MIIPPAKLIFNNGLSTIIAITLQKSQEILAMMMLKTSTGCERQVIFRAVLQLYFLVCD